MKKWWQGEVEGKNTSSWRSRFVRIGNEEECRNNQNLRTFAVVLIKNVFSFIKSGVDRKLPWKTLGPGAVASIAPRKHLSVVSGTCPQSLGESEGVYKPNENRKKKSEETFPTPSRLTRHWPCYCVSIAGPPDVRRVRVERSRRLCLPDRTVGRGGVRLFGNVRVVHGVEHAMADDGAQERRPCFRIGGCGGSGVRPRQDFAQGHAYRRGPVVAVGRLPATVQRLDGLQRFFAPDRASRKNSQRHVTKCDMDWTAYYPRD